MTEKNTPLFPNQRIESRSIASNKLVDSQERWAESLEAIIGPLDKATEETDHEVKDDELMTAEIQNEFA